MCRFILYQGEPLQLSSLITAPKNSLIHQSFHNHERREPLNGDGFGVAWYSNEDELHPGLFRSTMPAWNNANLVSLARTVQSHTILAHIRAASHPGAVSEGNCHPFVAGQLSFMHNGQLGGFPALRRSLLTSLTDEAFGGIHGHTDTEHIFALFLEQLEVPARKASADDLAEALLRAMGDALRFSEPHVEVGEESHLNLAVSNGHCAAVSRFTTKADYDSESLYWISGCRCVHEGDMCCMEPAETGPSSVVVSSERLDTASGWSSVPRNHIVLIHSDGSASLRQIQL